MEKQKASSRDSIKGFGAALRARRETAGWSLAQLAERSGTSLSAISMLERDQRSPSLRLAADLASALGVTVDVLLMDAARLSTSVAANPENAG